MVYFADGVLVSGVEIILEMDFVRYAIQELEIYSFMIHPPNLFNHPPQPQYETYSCELCGNDSHHGYDCPPRFPLECSIPLRDIIFELPLSVSITPDLPITDSLIMGDEELSTIPEKESDEFIKSSVEDLVPIPSEFEDTSESDCDCDYFSPINVYEEKFVTFSNPLFDSNDDFTSSDERHYPMRTVPGRKC
ncbi:hypothetical protein Tco_0795381 [Tanacetum coccineum]